MNAKQIEKNSRKFIQLRNAVLSETLIGSIITSIGILNGRTIEENYKLFNTIKRNKQLLEGNNTVEKLVEYINTVFGKSEDRAPLASLVLISDLNDVYTPLVAISLDDGETGAIMPLRKDGLYTGILTQLGKDNIQIEFIFDEDGNPYEDEIN